MKKLLTLLGVLSAAVAYAQSNATTITFNELPAQPVNGLTFKGVSFTFKIAGVNSTDARFNANGPGTLTYISDPSLEGSTAGILGLDFAVPVSHLSFGVAVASTTVLTPGVTVSLYDSDFALVGKIPVTTQPIAPYTFSEALFTEEQSSVSHVSLFFNNSGQRFVLDNLSFTPVPEPSTI